MLISYESYAMLISLEKLRDAYVVRKKAEAGCTVSALFYPQ